MKPFLFLFFIMPFVNTSAQNCPVFSLTNYTYIATEYPIGVISNDFNNDGKKDLVVQNYSFTNFTNYITTYLQTTANNFATFTTSIGSGNNLISSDDYNNDSYKDILSNYFTFLGNGTGNFTSLSNNLPALYSRTVFDFNNNGSVDVVGTDGNNTVYFCDGLLNGTFSTVVSFTNTTSNVIGCNLNNDANKDLILFASPSNSLTEVKLFYGNGNGTFSPVNTYTYNADIAFAGTDYSLKITDVDGDGNDDMVILFSTNQLSFMKGNGNGTFNPPVNSTLSNAQPFAITDVNNDGFKDILTATPTGSVFTVQSSFNNGNFNFVSPVTTFSCSNNYETWSSKLIVEDFNGDLKKDLAVYTYSGNATSVKFIFTNSNCIWPGDANYDGVVNTTDILEMGLHMTQTGPPRATTSNAWSSFTCAPWSGSVSNGSNLNNADCNGDGIITSADTLAVYQNYSFMHNLREASATTTTPQITIVPDQTTVYKDTWGTASIFLGNASLPIANINGAAFTVNYNHNLIQADSVYLQYVPSFINSNNLEFKKRDFYNNVIYTATTHTVNNNVNGNGKIAVLHYKIKPNLVSDSILNLSISSGEKIETNGTVTQLSSGAGTLLASTAIVTNVKNNTISPSISLYPNPTSGLFTIITDGTVPKDAILKIYNSLGQLVQKEEINTSKEQFDLQLKPGVYYYSITNFRESSTMSKLIIE